MAIQVYLSDLRDPFDARSTLDTLTIYYESPMGNGVPLPDSIRDSVIDGIKNCANHRVFLAVETDPATSSRRPVGMAVCFVNYSTFRAKPLINVHDLVVHPEYQARGIGRQLLEQVVAYSKEHQFCAVTLEVRRDNINALKLYRRLGFQGIEEDAASHAMLFGKLTLV